MSGFHTNGWTYSQVVTAAISLTTTKHLLNHAFHFPMHLLVLQLVCDLAFRLCFAAWSFWLQGRPRYHWCRNAQLNRHLLHAVCLSGAVLCGYQAVQHFANLPTVVMIFSLDWRLLGQGPSSTGGKSKLKLIATQLTFLVGITMIVAFDHRVSMTGIILLMLALGFAALLQHSQININQKQASAQECPCGAGRMNETPAPLHILDFWATLASALFWCHFREQQFSEPRPYPPLTSDFLTLTINLSFTTIFLALKGDYLGRALPYEGRERSGSLTSGQTGQRELTVALVSLIVISSTWIAAKPLLISPLQIMGYSISLFATFTSEEFSAGDWSSREGGSRAKGFSLIAHDHFSKLKPYLWVLFLLWTWCVVLLQSWKTERLLKSVPQSSLRLDDSYQPDHTFDVVVARYDEPTRELARHLTDLLSLPVIQPLRPNIVVYNKGENTTSPTLSQELQVLLAPYNSTSITIHSIENIGRETDTYLEHITRNWHSLATHTLFMQASVHYTPWAFTHRIRDYFIPATGFLSLAPSGSFCLTCEQCYDRDWTENPAVLRTIFEDYNHGVECTDMVLTYRGQFIASAARIRGNNLQTYEQLLHALRSPQSIYHTAPYNESIWSVKKDSMSAPRIGFTLERMWGTIMQCHGKRISYRCPSLLSKLICPPAICGTGMPEDCQCLDD